uniref:Uncharacterized protein n=1 Tax=Meloidogyne javanica TaxID=6303 RepID=A0A915M7I9_MELJA
MILDKRSQRLCSNKPENLNFVPTIDTFTRSRFNELKKIALSGGSTQSNDVLIYEEFVFMESFDETNSNLSWHLSGEGAIEEYKIMKEIYKNAIDKLTEKVETFVEEQINAHYSDVDAANLKEDIEKYDHLIATGKFSQKISETGEDLL